MAFPRQAPVEGTRAVMAAKLIGDLVLVDGCLRVNSIYGAGNSTMNYRATATGLTGWQAPIEATNIDTGYKL